LKIEFSIGTDPQDLLNQALVWVGETLAGDVFRGLDYYLGLAGGGTGDPRLWRHGKLRAAQPPRAELVAVRVIATVPSSLMGAKPAS